MRALVVFRDGSHPLSWLLKKGFQHCFVCIDSNGLWIQVEGSEVPVIKYLTTSDFDLASHLRGMGFTVVETYQGRSVTFPFAARNCVGLVKTILCITSWSLTPYGLYKYLTRKH